MIKLFADQTPCGSDSVKTLCGSDSVKTLCGSDSVRVIEFPETILKISTYLKYLHENKTFEEEPIPILNYDDWSFEIFKEWFKPLDETLHNDEIEKWYLKNFEEEFPENLKLENLTNEIFHSAFFEKFTPSQKIKLFNFALGNQIRLMCESIAYTMRNEKVYKKNEKYFICTGFNEEIEQFENYDIGFVLYELINKWNKLEYEPDGLLDIHFHKIARKYSWPVLYKLYIVWKKYGFEYFKTSTFSKEFAEVWQLFDITELNEVDEKQNLFSLTCLRPGYTIDEYAGDIITLEKENDKYVLYFAFNEIDSVFSVEFKPTFHNFLAFTNGCIKYKCCKMDGIYPFDDLRYEIKDTFEKKVLLFGFKDVSNETVPTSSEPHDSAINVVCSSLEEKETNLTYLRSKYQSVIEIELNFISSVKSFKNYLTYKHLMVNTLSLNSFLMTSVDKPDREKFLRIFEDYKKFVMFYINTKKKRIASKLIQIEETHKQQLKAHLEEIKGKFDRQTEIVEPQKYNYDGNLILDDIDLKKPNEMIIVCSRLRNNKMKIKFEIIKKYDLINDQFDLEKLDVLIFDTKLENLTIRQVSDYLESKGFSVRFGIATSEEYLTINNIKQIFYEMINSMNTL